MSYHIQTCLILFKLVLSYSNLSNLVQTCFMKNWDFRMRPKNNGLNCWPLKSSRPKLMLCLNLRNTMFIWSVQTPGWVATKKPNNPRIYVKPLGKTSSVTSSKSTTWWSPKLTQAKRGRKLVKKTWMNGN